jgi:hypothetical protein
MTNEQRDAEHANRPFSFTSNAASIIALCRGTNFWDAPNAELDMFSRWIRLSDRALAANRRNQTAGRSRRKCKTILSAKPA